MKCDFQNWNYYCWFYFSSNTLSTLCYNLAKDPNIQEKIYEEICSALDENGGILDHETTTKFEYMEAAIEEDLRLYPPGN